MKRNHSYRCCNPECIYTVVAFQICTPESYIGIYAIVVHNDKLALAVALCKVIVRPAIYPDFTVFLVLSIRGVAY